MKRHVQHIVGSVRVDSAINNGLHGLMRHNGVVETKEDGLCFREQMILIASRLGLSAM